MKTLPTLLALLFFLAPAFADEPRCYELRVYHASEGKIEELHARFRDHTVGLFEKHGMTNEAYWKPLDPEKADQLIYLLSYPSRAAREESWKTFYEDPEWKEAKAESEKEGKLVAKVESTFLHLTDYSPVTEIPAAEGARVVEMRHYTTNDGKLDDLDARFRDHTIGLFAKHGLTNLMYFHLDEDQEGAANILLYFIAAPSKEARDASFKAFAADPAWQSARDESEKDGKLLIKGGVQATMLEATDYSPVK